MNAEQINERLRHKNYYGDGHLHNDPKPYEGQAEPTVFLLRQFDIAGPPEFSVVMPVYNQAPIIEDIIASLIVNTTGVFELILICDACTDNTLSIIKQYVEALPEHLYERQILLTSVLVIKQDTPIFETSCDNIGFTLARGKYIVEVQADMKMIQYGYNRQLALPLRLYNDIFMISGRGVNSFNCHTLYGKVNHLIEKPLNIPLEDRMIVVTCHAVMRGPLVIDRCRLVELKYMDEQNFVLGNDDQDLCARAAKRGWISGYVPIEFYAPLSNGSCRKEMDADNKRILELRKARSNGGEFEPVKNTNAPLVARPLSMVTYTKAL